MKIESKMTAVEWLAKELESYGDPQIFKITWEDLDSLVNQAKEMEKQQLIKAVDYCLASVKLSDDKTMFTAMTAEQYYNETFNNED